MNTTKNILLAWISAGSPVIAAIGFENGLYAISAIVLPIVFFAIGKTVDVLLQIYLDKRKRRCGGSNDKAKGPPRAAAMEDVPE
ncbi:MAG TPA: hypothetical protein PKD26_15450 [Pyrinomonadaceae bacterium]|nr:hypothetical protein [Pyrinomonadaceae bacterium]